MSTPIQENRSLPGSAVPVIEETATVHKRLVDTGGYRIAKRVHARTERVEEILATHEVVIERRLIGRRLDEAEFPKARQEGDTLIIPVMQEVLVTTTHRMLLEEVRITEVHGTRRVQEDLNLRTEEIVVERLDPDTSASPGSD